MAVAKRLKKQAGQGTFLEAERREAARQEVQRKAGGLKTVIYFKVPGGTRFKTDSLCVALRRVCDYHGVRGPGGLRFEVTARGKSGTTCNVYKDGADPGQPALVCCPTHVRDWAIVLGVEEAPMGWWDLWKDLWVGFNAGGKRYQPDFRRTGYPG